MNDNTADETDDVSNKMEDLMIAHQSDQKRVNEILLELDRKIAETQKRLTEEENKRTHTKEVHDKMEGKVKIAKMKVEESYQRMMKQKHIMQEQQSKTEQLKSQQKNLQEIKASFVNTFNEEIKNITNKLKDLRVDPFNYHPEEEVASVQQEAEMLDNEKQRLLLACEQLKSEIFELELNQPPKTYAGSLSGDEALQLIRELEAENESTRIETLKLKEELDQLSSC